MTDKELKNTGWQLVTDASGQTHWRDPEHPVRTYPLDLAIREQEKRDRAFDAKIKRLIKKSADKIAEIE